MILSTQSQAASSGSALFTAVPCHSYKRRGASAGRQSLVATLLGAKVCFSALGLRSTAGKRAWLFGGFTAVIRLKWSRSACKLSYCQYCTTVARARCGLRAANSYGKASLRVHHYRKLLNPRRAAAETAALHDERLLCLIKRVSPCARFH